MDFQLKFIKNIKDKILSVGITEPYLHCKVIVMN